jgi:hypothetical protein
MEFDWQDIALAGALAEEIVEEEFERRLECVAENHDPLDEIEEQPEDIDIEDLIP